MIRDPEFPCVQKHDLRIVIKENAIKGIQHKLGEVVEVCMPWEPWHTFLERLGRPFATMIVT